ncbi:MAG: ATP-binding protein [Candidatus Altiarchaeota archaeon]
MMDARNLRKVIEGGENMEVELKQSLHSVQDAARIICAFANTQGGILIVGVKDDGLIVGVEGGTDLIQQRISQANATIHPTPNTSIEVHTAENKKLAIVIVHKADTSVFHSVGGVIYIRLGSTIAKLEGQSIVEFLRNRQILLFEESTDSSARVDDIDANKVRDYLEVRGQSDYLKTHSLQDFLISKKLASFQLGVKIKNSAILFFAKDLQAFLPYTQIKLVRFDGREPVKVLAYEEAKGSLPQIIEQSMNFVRRFITKEFIIQDMRRREMLSLPEEAVREAVINAIAHRDYFNKNEVQLSIFDDRLEITNPGGLPEGMTRELLGALSIQRNPIIYQLLKDYRYMEGLGSGISKIYRLMSENRLESPEFITSKDFFRIVLRMVKKPWTEGVGELNRRQIKALEYLKKNATIKSREYASINRVSTPTAVKDLTQLESRDMVRRVGSNKTTHYILS